MAIIGSAWSKYVIGSYYGSENVARVHAVSGTNGTVVKAAPGAVSAIVITNNAASARYFRLYDATAVTVGTTTPLATLVLEPSTGQGICAINLAPALPFQTGICFSITGATGDSDTTSVSANDLDGFLIWS
jgi:hypothetical protein